MLDPRADQIRSAPQPDHREGALQIRFFYFESVLNCTDLKRVKETAEKHLQKPYLQLGGTTEETRHSELDKIEFK